MNLVKTSITATVRKTEQAAMTGKPTPQENQRQSPSAPLMQKSSPTYRKNTAAQGRSESRSQAYVR